MLECFSWIRNCSKIVQSKIAVIRATQNNTRCPRLSLLISLVKLSECAQSRVVMIKSIFNVLRQSEDESQIIKTLFVLKFLLKNGNPQITVLCRNRMPILKYLSDAVMLRDRNHLRVYRRVLEVQSLIIKNETFKL